MNNPELHMLQQHAYIFKSNCINYPIAFQMYGSAFIYCHFTLCYNFPKCCIGGHSLLVDFMHRIYVLKISVESNHLLMVSTLHLTYILHYIPFAV